MQPREIIVIDDGSVDSTASIAMHYGAKVLNTNTLRENWKGKSAACWLGANEANGDFLLFLDADTFFEHPDSLQNLMQTYERYGKTGILSVQPFHRIKKSYENLSLLFNMIVFAGMNVFTIFRQKYHLQVHSVRVSYVIHMNIYRQAGIKKSGKRLWMILC